MSIANAAPLATLCFGAAFFVTGNRVIRAYAFSETTPGKSGPLRGSKKFRLFLLQHVVS